MVLAEDDDDLRRVLEAALTDLGYTVRAAADGAQALALVRDQDGDLTLMLDWYMEPVSGRDVLRALQGSGRRVRVVIMSASPRVADPVLPDTVPWLHKPFGLPDLLVTLHAPALRSR